MPRNEKGSFRGSSDQRGERPGHLHNCRISEHGLQPGHLTGGCSSLAQGLRSEGRLQTVLLRGQKRRLPRERDTGVAGPRAGCWGTAALPDGRKPSGTAQGARPSGARRVPRGPLPLWRWCRWGSAPCSHSATSAAPSQRAASPAAGGWLPARRLALPPASGDKGIKRHARSAGRGWGRHLAPASRSPRTPPPPPAPPAPRRCPRPAPAAGRHRARPRGLIVPATNRGCRRRSRCSGRRGSPLLLPGRGCPGTPFSAILNQQSWLLATGAPSPPFSLRSPFYARTMLTEMRGFPPP